METEMGNEVHYKVKIFLDGKWFKNAYVFPSRAEATQYGESMEVEKYRLVVTSEPVALPPPEEPFDASIAEK